VQLVEDCRQIADRLQQGAPVIELEAITAQSAERDLEVLAGQVRSAIDNNQPEAGLDRLHTFVVNYVRRRCDQRGIAYDRDEPLHSLFGKYRKSLESDGHVESEMGRRILKSVIATLDAFNEARNNRSLAHDNPLLNYDEALLICNHMCSLIRFLNAVEGLPSILRLIIQLRLKLKPRTQRHGSTRCTILSIASRCGVRQVSWLLRGRRMASCPGRKPSSCPG
jgi:hypothetical protein